MRPCAQYDSHGLAFRNVHPSLVQGFQSDPGREESVPMERDGDRTRKMGKLFARGLCMRARRIETPHLASSSSITYGAVEDLVLGFFAGGLQLSHE